MGHALGLVLQGGFNDPLSLALIIVRFAPATGSDLPDLPDALLVHPLAPQLHGGSAHAEPRGDGHILLTRHGSQDNPATQRHLTAVAGQQNVAIAAGLGVSRPTVQLWRKRVHEQGIGEVWEIAPGRGRKARYDQGQRDRIIQATLQSKPKGMTHWSCRLMAKAQGVSKNTVNRLWQLHNIKPHLSRTFKLSRDAKFLEKLTDVVGLYMNPPDKALVLCLDEKSQIQALDRTKP